MTSLTKSKMVDSVLWIITAGYIFYHYGAIPCLVVSIMGCLSIGCYFMTVRGAEAPDEAQLEGDQIAFSVIQ